MINKFVSSMMSPRYWTLLYRHCRIEPGESSKPVLASFIIRWRFYIPISQVCSQNLALFLIILSFSTNQSTSKYINFNRKNTYVKTFDITGTYASHVEWGGISNQLKLDSNLSIIHAAWLQRIFLKLPIARD